MAKKNRKSKRKRIRTSSPETLHIVQYKITDEPIEERAFRKLPDSVKKQLEGLLRDAQRKPEQAIPQLLELKKRYPNIPLIYNYLAVAYAASKETELAEATVKENMRRNPDYLFARVNYAEICFARQEYERIPEIFDYEFDLKALYPNRKRFHISEFANFMGVMGFYFAKADQWEMAERYNEMLQETAPSSPLAKRMNKELNPGLFIRLLKPLAGEPPVDPQP